MADNPAELSEDEFDALARMLIPQRDYPMLGELYVMRDWAVSVRARVQLLDRILAGQLRYRIVDGVPVFLI